MKIRNNIYGVLTTCWALRCVVYVHHRFCDSSGVKVRKTETALNINSMVMASKLVMEDLKLNVDLSKPIP